MAQLVSHLHMRSSYSIVLNADLMVNEFDFLCASVINSRRCFILLINFSNKPIAW